MSLLNRGRLRKLIKQWRRPRTVLEYGRVRAAFRLRSLTVPTGPLHFDIEPINACNLKCAHCQVSHWQRETVRLTVGAFESLLDGFGRLLSVKLQGMGEPFLNPELVPMLKAGEACGIAMRVVSNGSLCHGQTVDELLQLRNTELTFSLDGASSKVFEAIRVGSNFHDVCDNIGTLIRLRGHRRQPMVGVTTVITRQNAHEVPDIVALAARLHVDGIVLRPTVGNWGKESMRPHTDPIRLDRSETAPILEQAQAVAKKRGTRLAIYRPEGIWRNAVCPWPWTGAFIAANGDVVPCCRISDPDTVCMGNAFEKPFSQIWNSKGYRDLRERLRDHNLPSFCANCQAAGG